MEIVINDCHGLFSLSSFGIEKYKERTGITIGKYADNIPRTDADLIAIVKIYGSEAVSGYGSNLTVVDVPAGTRYIIHEYDGLERIIKEKDIKWETAT